MTSSIPIPSTTGLDATDDMSMLLSGVTDQPPQIFQDTLFVSHASDDAGGEPSEMQDQRVFYPSNREDSLLLLSGLCISSFFPDPAVKLAIDGQEIGIVEKGLRSLEEDLLCGGRLELFPVLIEIRPEYYHSARVALEHNHIKQLVFRTQEDADAFRYRPVDEFNTDTFPCLADKTCFGLEGPSRFHLRSFHQSELIISAQFIDRLIAGLQCMISIATNESSCRKAVEYFLSSENNLEQNAEIPKILTLCEAYEGRVSDKGIRLKRVILSAFAESVDSSPRTLLDQIVERLSREEGISDEDLAVASKWIAFVDSILANRATLSGYMLSDEKSVFLRSALLAMVASSIDSLIAFHHSEPPSGPHVTVLAAFLFGFRQGLIAMPWDDKTSHANQLSAASALLMRHIPLQAKSVGRLLSVAHEDYDDKCLTRISLGHIELGRWEGKIQAPVFDKLLITPVDTTLSEVAKDELDNEQFSVLDLPNGKRLEVTLISIDSLSFSVLKWRPAKGLKIVAQRIKSANELGGKIWYPRRDADGKSWLLCCELPLALSDASLSALGVSLDMAISFYFQSQMKKSSRKRSGRTQRYSP